VDDRSVNQTNLSLRHKSCERFLIQTLMNPRLLILDEATSALYTDHELHILDRLKPMKRDMTIVAVAHRPSFLDIADQVFEISEGKLSVRKTAAIREHR